MTYRRFLVYCCVLILAFLWIATQCATVKAVQSNDIDAPALQLALIYARTDDEQIREQTANSIRAILDAGDPIPVAVTVAADLIDLRQYDPALYNRLHATGD